MQYVRVCVYRKFKPASTTAKRDCNRRDARASAAHASGRHGATRPRCTLYSAPA